MSDKKHTPRPWRWSPLDDDGPLSGRNGKIVLQPGYTAYSCDRYGDIFGTIKASAADKKLIAAAPDMLEALKSLLAFVNSLGMEFGGVSKEKYLEAYEPLNKAHAAISKAEGVITK